MTFACRVIAFASLVILITGCTKKSKTSGTTTDWISDFSVVDDSVADGYPNWEIHYATKDSNGNLYVNTTTSGSGWQSTWKILRSTDQGETWSVVETSSAPYGVSYGIAADSLGNVYAVGAESVSGTNFVATVRKFDGTSWSVVHTFQVEPGQSSFFRSVAVDSSDNVYVLGEGDTAIRIGLFKIVVLKSVNHGSTWSQVDTYFPEDNNSCKGTNLLVTSSDEIYTSGYCMFGLGQSYVRKSSDQGASWSLVYEAWDRKIKGLAEWNGGIIFAADFSETSVKVFHTEDDFDHLTELYDSGTFETAYVGSLRVDSRGYIYLSATFVDDLVAGTGYSLIAGTHDGTWETLHSDSFDLESPFEYINDIFFSDSGHVFYVAPYFDTEGNTLHIARADLNVTTAWSPDPLGDGEDLASPIADGAKIIYTTSLLTDGHLGSTPAIAISSADFLCNADPNKPTYATGTFKALLVNSARVACTTPNCGGGIGEHIDWVIAPSQLYVTRKGTTFSSSNSVGLFTTMTASLGNYTPANAWTGLLNSPTADWTIDPDFHCLGWTTNSAAEWSPYWVPAGSDFSSIYQDSVWDTCDQYRTLICVEQ